ncbi:MAG: hypothetical protein R6U63_10690, partial [Longimicrobiales bacterium]
TLDGFDRSWDVRPVDVGLRLESALTAAQAYEAGRGASLASSLVSQLELLAFGVRLTIPRRVYTQSHIDYVVEVILEVFGRRKQIGGFRFTHQASVLRHFTARFEPTYGFGA